MEAFDIFNREYETKALSVCPELKNITIDAVCNYDSAHLAEQIMGTVLLIHRTLSELCKPNLEYMNRL